MIFLNKNMKNRVLGELAGLPDYPRLPAGLKAIIEGGFIEINGCYFFKSFTFDGLNLTAELVRQRFGDFVGYEVSKNTIHIDDFASERSLSLGLAFCREFSKRWAIWTQVPCKLVLAAKENEFGESTTFRFYVPRLGEEYMDFTNTHDLDEAIMAVDVLPGIDIEALSFEGIFILAGSQ